MPDNRSIELEIEVVGTPEEVWRAIATGPGISSWYVPHEVEERQGGTMSASFGPGLDIAGRVAEWDPPNRVLFDGGEGVEGLAFEWTVEARDGGRCVVRLVNTGFGSGEDWDDQYDAMSEGWLTFLVNLSLHLEHFGGQTANPSLSMAAWDGPRDRTWATLATALGLATTLSIGDRIEVDEAGTPALAGTIAEISPYRLSVLLEKPSRGTAFLSAEGRGDSVEVALWCYLYGADAGVIAERDQPLWQAWLVERDASTT